MSFWTGDDGKKADPADRRGLDRAVNSREAYSDAQSRGSFTPQLIADYQSGKISLADALGQAQAQATKAPTLDAGGQYGSWDDEIRRQNPGAAFQGYMDALGTNGITGTKVASDIVRSDPMSSGLFGSGGIQDQAQGRYGTLNGYLDQDRQALMGRDDSYGLTDNDLKAYGQGSDSIARQYGSQDASLAQSLADRGLSQAPSGAAMQAFSGLAGNKNEQLAKAQMQMSQNRINTAQQLAQFRATSDAQQQSQNNSLISNLGTLGEKSVNDQYGRQLAGAEQNANQLSQNAATQMQNTDLQQNINNSNFGQEQSTKSGGLFGAVGDAVTKGVADQVGDAVGGYTGKQIASNVAGGVGKAVGSKI